MKIRYVIIFFWVCCNSYSQEIIIIDGAEKEVIPKIGEVIQEFHENSKAMKRLKYVSNNKLYIVNFSKEGVKLWQGEYPLENLLHKRITSFYENGNIFKIADFKYGIADGVFREFYKNGNPKEFGKFSRISKDGIWNYYNSEGVLIKQKVYDNDRLLEVKEFN